MTMSSRYEELVAGLRRAGLKLTPQRRAICRALSESRTHPSAQQLHTELVRQVPALSLATVYNTLQVLVDLGLVHELGTAVDGAIHYDADVEPHVNLVCTHCGRIVDFQYAPLATVERAVTAQSGYRIQGARVVYYGLCPVCQGEVG